MKRNTVLVFCAPELGFMEVLCEKAPPRYDAPIRRAARRRRRRAGQVCINMH